MPLRQLLIRIVLAVGLATIAISVAHKTQHFDLATAVADEHRIVAGQDIVVDGQVVYPFYNRVLFPFTFVTVAQALPGANQAHLFVALRFLAFAACFLLIFSAIDARAGQPGVNAPAMNLAVGIAFIASLIFHPEPHTSDIFDLAIMFYVFLLLGEERLVAAFLLACLTAINRESGAFAGPAYFLLRADSGNLLRVAAISAAFTIVPYALAIAVRHAVYVGEIPSAGFGQALIGLHANLADMATDLLRFNPANNFYLLLAMLALPAVLLAQRPLGVALKARIVAAFAAIFAVTLLFGLVRELRIFLPCVALLAAATVARFPSLTSPAREATRSSRW